MEVKAPTDNVKSGKDQNPNEDIVPANDFHNDSKHAEKTQRHNTDDDGKTHHFHFNRIAAHKGRKMFLLFLSKLILAITHACCFIYCCLHVFH
ncbi:MAG: hypothetical protein JWR72_3465 [Flavisolibacter sp.]|nr:hypothetical protein [Flavisolibacter sp.]